MAAKHETPVSFKTTVAVFWKNELKTECGKDYEEAKNRLFAILGWLGRANLGNPFVASCDLASYLKFSVSKYVLSYGPSIFINCSRFPYEEDTVNEWFHLFPEDDWPERGEAVQAINVDKGGFAGKCYSTQSQVENVFPDSLEDDEFEVFFHGTSHESAKDKIEGEIYLRGGKSKRDFSDGDGFYLSKDFDVALRCARYKSESSAVLVFRLNRTELRGDNNEKGYDLRAPDMKREWKEVVRNFRNGRLRPRDRKEMNRLYQFIEGPMASISEKNPESALHPRQIDNSYQLCIRTKSCVELFNRGLHSVVFFVE